MKTFVTSAVHMYPGEWEVRTTTDDRPYILLPNASLILLHMNTNELRDLGYAIVNFAEILDERKEVEDLSN